MAGSRTLKLSILGDVNNLNKNLKGASADVDTFGDKIGKAGKVIGAAFAAAVVAAGTLAIKIGIEGVKAAIEDEKAQTQLALALENSTGATKAQIAETESQILKMSLASGVADDDLRPALGRLVRSTGDTSKAQELLAQALDISTATGKPLETVAAALSKGFDGNTTALGKLGIGLSTAELQTMTFTDVQNKLTDLFGGASAANAETYAGKIARVQVAFSEAKETLGTALLPILDKFLSFINQNALPAIEAFTKAFSLTDGAGFGKTITDVGSVIKKTVAPIFEGAKKVFDSVKTAIMDSKDEFAEFFEVVKVVAPIIGKVIGAALSVIGDIAKILITVFAQVLAAIKPLINRAIDGINLVIKGINLIKPGADIASIGKIGATSGGGSGFSGTTPGGKSFSGGITVPKIAVPKLAVPTVRTQAAEANAPIINLNVTGAIDKEGTARTIVETLNNSFYRGGGGGGNSLVVA